MELAVLQLRGCSTTPYCLNKISYTIAYKSLADLEGHLLRRGCSGPIPDKVLQSAHTSSQQRDRAVFVGAKPVSFPYLGPWHGPFEIDSLVRGNGHARDGRQ